MSSVMALEDAVLDDRHEKYLAWLLTPQPERDPSSKEKYAAANGVAVQTLRNWEKRQSFRTEWAKRVDQTQQSPEKKQNLLDSLYAKAMGGDMRAAELFLKVTGGIVPTVTKIEVEKKSAELTDAELDQLIAQRAATEKDARSLTPNLR